MRFALHLLPLLAVLGLPRLASAAAWEDATAMTIGATAEWSNKVELADINGDGLVDILFANGAGYSSPKGAEQSRVFLNQGAGKMFKEVSAEVFPKTGQTRVIKARDINEDGFVDLVVGNTYESQSWLYLGDGKGGFTDATANLPQKLASIGDLEIGDIDGDGHLDIVLADWGPGNAGGEGGVTQLWLGDGTGKFTDATATNMPDIKISWSWEMDLADVDNDYDLDVLVSCKTCDGSFMFHNNNGVLTDASDQLPQFSNNYEFEALDVNGDTFVDLITINDGPMVTEHIFLGDGLGGFEDATAELWPAVANPPGDDNMVAFLDVESDGDPDFVICGLFGGVDRLVLNDGMGNLSLEAGAFLPATSSGSLGIALADLDGDKRIDVVFAEGESAQDEDRVFLGVDVPVDSAAPVFPNVEIDVLGADISVRARIHDNKTPVMPHDFTEVHVELLGDGNEETKPLTWYGEALWRATVPNGEFVQARVCATDAAGNSACSESVDIGGGATTGDETSGSSGETTDATSDATSDDTGTPTTDATSDTPTSGDTPTEGAGSTGPDDTMSPNDGDGSDDAGLDDDDGGCGCRGGEPTGAAWLLALGVLLVPRRRR